MTVATSLRNRAPLVTVVTFTVACMIGFGYLWVNSGGAIPMVAPHDGYKVSFLTGDVKNLQVNGDVKIAGVTVGHVDSRSEDNGTAKVTLRFTKDVTALHGGATVRIGVKSLIGSSYVDVVDGKGAAIPAGSMIPSRNVIPAVDADELFATLNAPTRQSLGHAVQELAVGTRGTAASLDQTMTGAGQIATYGNTALAALAGQSKDLQDLTGEARQLLDELDTGQGQITTLVTDAQQLTNATASKSDALRATVRELPGLITSVRSGASSLDKLAGPLAPVAANLRLAAPDLNQALVNLPAVTQDLSGLLPSLRGALQEAPATLTRLPAFDGAVRNLVPTARTTLADVDPMLDYLAPYGLDLGALFNNFGGSFDQVAEDGIMPIRLTATAEGSGSVRQIPLNVSNTGLNWVDPYPKPGEASNPKPFTGAYPHVQRQPR